MTADFPVSFPSPHRERDFPVELPLSPTGGEGRVRGQYLGLPESHLCRPRLRELARGGALRSDDRPSRRPPEGRPGALHRRGAACGSRRRVSRQADLPGPEAPRHPEHGGGRRAQRGRHRRGAPHGPRERRSGDGPRGRPRRRVGRSASSRSPCSPAWTPPRWSGSASPVRLSRRSCGWRSWPSRPGRVGSSARPTRSPPYALRSARGRCWSFRGSVPQDRPSVIRRASRRPRRPYALVPT